MAAFSVVELLLVLGVAATFAAIAAPATYAGLSDMRAAGAARHVVARLQQARTRAVMRGRSTALRFTLTAGRYQMTSYDDGNGNGVLAADVAAGIDQAFGAPEVLNDQFPGVDFGARPGLPGAEGSTAPGSDPIRLGVSDSVTFTADGSASAGSLYLIGANGAQYVVRIYGETGRTRVLRFTPTTGQWGPP